MGVRSVFGDGRQGGVFPGSERRTNGTERQTERPGERRRGVDPIDVPPPYRIIKYENVFAFGT